MAGENLNSDPAVQGEEKPEDQRTVPLKAVEDERHKRQRLETEVAELRGQVQVLTSTRAASNGGAGESPKELSAADLQNAVDEGKMTAAEAIEINGRQIERRLETKLTGKFEAELEMRTTAQFVTSEIAAYQEAIPALTDRDSAEFQKLKTEYQFLVKLGDPEDQRTELKAARAAFGDIAKLKAIKGVGQRETHQETGGGAEPSEGGSTEGWPKGMPADTRDYYQDQIAQGALADQKAAVTEWSYKPKHGKRGRPKAA